MKTKIAIAFLVSILLLVAWNPTPAVAATAPKNIKLTVTNQSLKPVMITLTGPKTYNLNAPKGKSVWDLTAGKYKYSYTACGIKKTGNLQINGSQALLKIEKCKTSKITIVNNSYYNQLRLSMSGPDNYNWTIPPRSILKVVVLRGSYRYSAYCGGGSKSGTVNVVAAAYIWRWYC